ncbi:MAG: tRNA lysidine(34) synthetase TilS [Cyclobacteriaceae bacterium]
MKEINPSFPESMELGKVKNAGIYELFQIERDRLKKEMVRVNEDGQLTISKMELNKFRNPGAVLFHLIEDLGFSVNTCLQVSLEPGDQSGKHFLSKTHRLVVDRHEIILTLKSTRASSDFPLMITTPGFTQADGYSLHIEESLCRIPEFPNVNLAVLDADKLAFPLEWRRWESGDYFTPLGMSGRKKISDMLVDMKTPVPVKENVTVLLSGGKIAWVPGIRISNEFRLTDESVRAYRLEYGKLQV